MILRSKKVMIPFNLFDAKNYKKQKFSFLNLPFTDNLFFRTESVFKTKTMNPHTKNGVMWCVAWCVMVVLTCVHTVYLRRGRGEITHRWFELDHLFSIKDK